MTPTQPSFAAAVEAAIAEVEAVARAATPGPWEDEDYSGKENAAQVFSWTAGWPTIDRPLTPADAAHIAANDPQTVLRRVKADRAILALHSHTSEFWHPGNDGGTVCDVSCTGCRMAVPCPTLLALASAYDVEPGRQEVGG